MEPRAACPMFAPLIDEKTDSAVSIATRIISRFPEMFAEDLGREFAQKLELTCEPPQLSVLH